MVGLRPLPTGFFLAPEEAPRGQLFSDSKAYAGTSRPLPKERGWGDSAVLAPGVTTPRELRLGVSPASTLRFPRGAGGTTRAHLRPPASGPGPAGHRWDGVHGVSIPARSRGPGGRVFPLRLWSLGQPSGSQLWSGWGARPSRDPRHRRPLATQARLCVPTQLTLGAPRS